jgi:uncharacterized protein
VTTFVDTSALYALLDEDDRSHQAAVSWLRGPGADPAELLVTHSFVAVETLALVHRRLGTDAVRALLDGVLPAISVFQVDEDLYRAGVTAFRSGLKAGSSFVDHVSFEFMRWRELVRAFCFDADFAEAGFEVAPP